MVNDAEFKKANTRGKTRLAKTPVVIKASYDSSSGFVDLYFSNGIRFSIPPDKLQGLESATLEQLEEIEISPAGLGIHFPAVDADIYVPSLLEGVLGTKKWTASQLGKSGGNAKSQSKAEASRKNGKLGGRPRKDISKREKTTA